MGVEMRALVTWISLLWAAIPVSAAEMSVWIVMPDETVLSAREVCESDRRCQVEIEDWGYLIALGAQGVFDSLVTSPDGVRYGRLLNYDATRGYTKERLFHYRDSIVGQE
ncbi:hypothetical protein MesoLjLc_22330 [Mesorhizobium sp. L-8-10]|uniref:hypothetical protein n=1 Tax=Mesorhizobium sp. L-8-10 TaxID=2744523 RepID=UPI001925D6B4|nr:hypothetical protein [Mesorhizobium sp. L-8-10]BCH30303.1 hypothetical protein MesoLjLc_22330 [Mesorhizobium sp. L-8-10]